ncbi:MAG: hypothetical protein IJB99_08925, partial [Clostridia bacterium]|nr:hypothetical protein [Clostridia bacterium]
KNRKENKQMIGAIIGDVVGSMRTRTSAFLQKKYSNGRIGKNEHLWMCPWSCRLMHFWRSP